MSACAGDFSEINVVSRHISFHFQTGTIDKLRSNPFFFINIIPLVHGTKLLHHHIGIPLLRCIKCVATLLKRSWDNYDLHNHYLKTMYICG